MSQPPERDDDIAEADDLREKVWERAPYLSPVGLLSADDAVLALVEELVGAHPALPVRPSREVAGSPVRIHPEDARLEKQLRYRGKRNLWLR